MNQRIYIAYLNTFTFACIQMVLYTTIPYIAEKTGVVTANIIAAISIGSFIFSFMGPFWAARSDKLGRKRVLSFGMLGMSFSFALLASLFIFNDQLSLTIKICFVYISRIVYGLLASAIVPVSQAWQLDLSEKSDHLKVLTRNSMCLNLGRVLGPILILFKQVNFEYVIYCATIWVFTLAISVLVTSQANTVTTNHFAPSLKQVLNRWKDSFKESYMPILLALVFTSFTGVLHSFLGHHLKNALQITGQEATLMFAKIIFVLSVLAVLFQQLSITIFASRWRPRLFLGTIAIVSGTYTMMIATNEKLIWISIFMIAISTAFIPPVYLSLTSKSKENSNKTNVFGKKLGLASVAHSFGYALGMGLIALSLKMKVIHESWVVALISFSIALLSILMFRKIENTKSSHSEVQHA